VDREFKKEEMEKKLYAAGILGVWQGVAMNYLKYR
jgi:hypothetical protein